MQQPADSMERLEQYLQQNRPAPSSDTRRLSDIAYETLQDALRNADVQPGDPLSENRISKALGISRTPVREALQQLAGDGVLQIIPGRAITVATRTLQDVLDALHIRQLIEPELVRLLAERMNEHDTAALLSLTDAMRDAAKRGDRAAWSKADRQWHEILCSACPNQLLGQMVLQSRNRMYSKGAGQHVSEQYLIEGTEEHAEIVDAITDGDGETAARLMADHIAKVRANMFKGSY